MQGKEVGQFLIQGVSAAGAARRATEPETAAPSQAEVAAEAARRAEAERAAARRAAEATAEEEAARRKAEVERTARASAAEQAAAERAAAQRKCEADASRRAEAGARAQAEENAERAKAQATRPNNNYNEAMVGPPKTNPPRQRHTKRINRFVLPIILSEGSNQIFLISLSLGH